MSAVGHLGGSCATGWHWQLRIDSAFSQLSQTVIEASSATTTRPSTRTLTTTSSIRETTNPTLRRTQTGRTRIQTTRTDQTRKTCKEALNSTFLRSALPQHLHLHLLNLLRLLPTHCALFQKFPSKRCLIPMSPSRVQRS
jgi:hypothetical protein